MTTQPQNEWVVSVWKLVTLVRSDIQVNAYTTYGPFASDEEAKHFITHGLGGEHGDTPGKWTILRFSLVDYCSCVITQDEASSTTTISPENCRYSGHYDS